MKFENVEIFSDFLEKNLKTAAGGYTLDACLADLERQIGETGADHYELSSHETFSGWPETISFERVDQTAGDDVITTVIF